MIYGCTPPGGAQRCGRTTPLTPTEIQEVVDTIVAGRMGRHSVVLPGRLHTQDWDSISAAALGVADALPWKGCGWKVGAASSAVREAEGLPAPVVGRLFEERVFTNYVVLPKSLFINYREVECEFVFRMSHSLPPPRADCYTCEEVAGSVGSMVPVLEIGDMVFEDWYGASGYFGSCLDNGGGGVLVCGSEVDDWRHYDRAGARVELSVNDLVLKSGAGRAAMGDPLSSLTWLVNWLGAHGTGLEPGAVVSTGTCTGHSFLASGDRVSARFERIGCVEATFA